MQIYTNKWKSIFDIDVVVGEVSTTNSSVNCENIPERQWRGQERENEKNERDRSVE